MARNNAANLDVTNNADGAQIGGGITQRILKWLGANITLTGSGANTYTFPSATDTLVGRASTDTLTNKTIDGDDNTLQDIATSSLKTKTGADANVVTGTAGTNGDLATWNTDGDIVDGPTPPTGTIVGTSDTQTLTNKTLTSPVINTSVSGTAVKDEDDMASDSATHVATQQSIKAYTDTEISKIPVSEWTEFSEISGSFTTSYTSSQGVATDGTYIYTTQNSFLYKYNMSGVLQTSRDISADGTDGHIGDLCYNPDDGYLYVIAENYSTTPKSSHVMKYNTSLAYQTEYDLSSTYWASSIAYKDSAFWVVYDDRDVIEKWDTSFTSVDATYTLDGNNSGTHKYNGIEWVDECVYLNSHEGTSPIAVRRFYFTGSEFLPVADLHRPTTYDTQGLAWDSTNSRMYFAKRGYDSVSDGVTFAEPRNKETDNIRKTGWIFAPGTWAYSSWNSNTRIGEITVTAGASSIYEKGMRVEFTQPTDGTKYGIIHKVEDTKLHIFMGQNYDLDNESVRGCLYSPVYAPQGFDIGDGWYVELSLTTSQKQSSPTNGTWYNAGSNSIAIGVGDWDVHMDIPQYGAANSGNEGSVYSTLSTGTSTESNPEFSSMSITRSNSGSGCYVYFTESKVVPLSLTTADTYYLNIKTSTTGMAEIGIRGDINDGSVRVESKYV